MEATNRDAVSLVDLLSNNIVIRQLLPYLPITAILKLAATSKPLRDVLQGDQETLRYLNLSGVKKAIVKDDKPLDTGGINWRSQRMDEGLTHDEFKSGPLRGIFRTLEKKTLLRNVQTLILDRLGVTAELVDEIINQDRFNVRILSVRGCQLNEGKLQQVLKYAVRPTRAKDMPRLRAFYFFGEKDRDTESSTARRRQAAIASAAEQVQPTGVMGSEGAQLGTAWNEKSRIALDTSLSRCEDRWYLPHGRVIQRKNNQAIGWAETLQDCEGIIAFDAVLCRGPRHDPSQAGKGDQEQVFQQYVIPTVANVALGSGCFKCGTTPEGPAKFPTSPTTHMPLLSPPPLHSTTIRQAQKPHLLDPRAETYPPLYIRCEICLKGRWCERCLKWWCENCYHPETAGKREGEVSLQSPTTTIQIPAEPQKFVMALCVEHCLREEMMAGAGSNGMWG